MNRPDQTTGRGSARSRSGSGPGNAACRPTTLGSGALATGIEETTSAWARRWRRALAGSGLPRLRKAARPPAGVGRRQGSRPGRPGPLRPLRGPGSAPAGRCREPRSPKSAARWRRESGRCGTRQRRGPRYRHWRTDSRPQPRPVVGGSGPERQAGARVAARRDNGGQRDCRRCGGCQRPAALGLRPSGPGWPVRGRGGGSGPVGESVAGSGVVAEGGSGRVPGRGIGDRGVDPEDRGIRRRRAPPGGPVRRAQGPPLVVPAGGHLRAGRHAPTPPAGTVSSGRDGSAGAGSTCVTASSAVSGASAPRRPAGHRGRCRPRRSGPGLSAPRRPRRRGAP